MKKKYLLAFVGVLASASIGLGATFALFSASDEDLATFTSGHICVTSDRDAGDTVPGPMFYVTREMGRTEDGSKLGGFPTGRWVPGDKWERTLQVYNGEPGTCTSDVDVDLTGVWADWTDIATLPAWIPIDHQDKALAERMYVKAYLPYSGGGRQVVAEGYLNTFMQKDAGGNPIPKPLKYSDSSIPMLAAGGSYQMQFEITFDRDADNTYQDMSMVVNFTVEARQH